MKRTVKDVISWLARIFPKDSKKVILESIPDMADSAMSVYDYMLKHYKGYKYYWMVDHPENFKKSKHTKYLNINKKYSLKNIYHIITSKYIFFTHRSFSFANTERQVVISLTHGVGFKEVRGLLQKNFTKVIAGSRESIDMLSYGHMCSPDQFLITGLPKNDRMISPSEGAKSLLKDYDRLIMWLPTYITHKNQGVGEDDNVFYPLSEKDLSRIDDELSQKNWLLLIKIHPAQMFKNSRASGYKNIRVVRSEYLSQKGVSLEDILGCASALITDHSSVGSDFLLLDRPIAYTLPVDVKSKIVDFVDINHFPGPKIEGLKDLLEFLNDIDKGNDSWRPERERLKEYFWGDVTGQDSFSRLFCQTVIGDPDFDKSE